VRELCTQKRKLREPTPRKVVLSEQASSVILHHLPQKKKDPGAPLISCIIGEYTFDRALLDLGASINLILTSLYERFGLGELRPTSVTLQLADRSVTTPRGIIEDVIVKVKDFYFPVDFLILDMDVPNDLRNTPIILGCPFLATAKANINCESGSMEIAFGDKKLTLDIFKVIRGFEDCGFIEELEDQDLETCMTINALEDSISFSEPNPQPSSMVDLPHPEEAIDFVHSQPLPLDRPDESSSASSLPSILNPP
jgi:hypothetical protein